jgi:DNA-binding transcriptional LysR family regulator
MMTNSLLTRDNLVAASDLLGYSSTRVARNATPRVRFAEFRVKELAWIRRVGVAYRNAAYMSPVARRFIEILKTTAKETAKEA